MDGCRPKVIGEQAGLAPAADLGCALDWPEDTKEGHHVP